MDITIVPAAPDDPRVNALVQAHVALMDSTSPPGACHRLEADALADDRITLLAATAGDQVVGIGAHADGDPDWGEVKSMHVAATHRGHGIGAALLGAIEGIARDRGEQVLRLETGTHLDAAIALYEAAGFVPRGPFGDYVAHPSTCFYEKPLG